MIKQIENYISDSVQTQQKILADESILNKIQLISETIISALKHGNKILFVGNVKDRIINGDILFHYLYSSEDSTKYYIGLPKEIEIVPDNTEWVGQVECAIRIKTIKK